MQLQKIASININGIKNVTTQSHLKRFLYVNDIDILFLQEVNDYELHFLLPTYKFEVNVGPNNRGTVLIFRYLWSHY